MVRIFIKGSRLVFQNNDDLQIDSYISADNFEFEKDFNRFIFYRKSDNKLLQTYLFTEILNEDGIAYASESIFLDFLLSATNTVTSFPYLYGIAESTISCHTPLLKFGTRTAISAGVQSVIWEGTSNSYPYITTAQQLKVVSSSANDTALGTGARTLFLQGLDASFNEISETISMNGLTQVTTINSYLRIYRSYVVTCGTSLINEGKITIYNNAGTVEQAVINISDAQTLMALWTVPSSKNAYMINGTVSTDSNKGARVSFFTRLNDGATLYPFQIKYRAFIFGGENEFPFKIPFKILPKTDIEIRVTTPVGAGVTSAGATFELWYENV